MDGDLRVTLEQLEERLIQVDRGLCARISTIEEKLEGSILYAILDLLQADPHQWSSRPCPTCRAITLLAARPFGCLLHAKKEREENQR